MSVTLTLTAVACQSLSESITTNTTLSAPCYNVGSSISVSQGATLTIEPGVTLLFDQGREMTVWSDGRLSAVGTAQEETAAVGVEGLDARVFVHQPGRGIPWG